MAKLTIDLREGFERDEVVIGVDGHEVFRDPDVTTKLQIGFASRVEVSALAPTSVVLVELPRLRIRRDIVVDVGRTPFVGIDRKGGSLEFVLSPDSFGYL